MTDPYEILGVSPEADEATLRRRYLELVRQHPPEKCPQQFSAIREAYEQLRDPVARLHNRLFETRTEESIEDIIADVRAQVRSAPSPPRLCFP